MISDEELQRIGRRGIRTNRTMIEGYIGLAKILSGDDETGESEFDASIAALEAREGEDAAFYAKQLVDVRALFEMRKAADAEAGR